MVAHKVLQHSFSTPICHQSNMNQINKPILSSLSETIAQLTNEFKEITPKRKETLGELTHYVQQKLKADDQILLNFICTHNSRRSHLAQLWAQTAAYYYDIPGVACFSGGTEATAFNPKAVHALQDAGFSIIKTTEGTNPVYEVGFSHTVKPILAYSKKYNDHFNPNVNFAAILTCAEAAENCPVVIGASTRIALPYDDPKDFDDTPQETAMYKESVRQIGREMFYAFSKVKESH